MIEIVDGAIERFWDKVDRRGPNECWNWTANKNRGYGLLASKSGRSPYKAHRLSYRIFYGDIPKGMEVCHKCDNPSCVNPNHLFLGTHADNMRDAKEKGRLSKNPLDWVGEKNPSAKFTNEQVKQIRKEYSNGALVKDLVKKYSCSNMGRIVNNRVYIDKNYHPINANARPRPFRKVLNNKQISEIEKSNLSSRKLAKIFSVSKATIQKVKNGDY